jgi:uncharacterized membrane-anchored protein
MRKWGFWIVLAVVLAAVNGLIAHKESVLRSGRRVLLRLAPVDPRSLMQGDYMILRYELAGTVPEGAPRDGRLVLSVAPDGAAAFVRVDDGRPLREGEQLLRYRQRTELRLGAESFFFQEGHGPRYQGARFGELRVAPDGSSVLVGLCDADGRALGR